MAELTASSAFQGYRRAVYAVTSSVTATSLNSGFVQTMRVLLTMSVAHTHGVQFVGDKRF